jgi:hypothetical protein
MEFLKRSIKKGFYLVGLEVYRRQRESQGGITSNSETEINQVLPHIAEHPGLQRLIASRVDGSRPVLVLGSEHEVAFYCSFLRARISDVRGTVWNWNADVELPEDCQIIVCSVPLSAEQWQVMSALKRRCGAQVTGIQELVLPFTVIQFAQQKLNYYIRTIDEIAPYYLGELWFGPIDRLNELFPLKGKRVIEFGPFEGKQTAGLVHSNVEELTCIEARAENLLKTLIAKEVFGWHNVRLVMDDFHNVDATKYGRFDLVWAHGVYYHALSPFTFLENMISLSDHIFLGGYVLKENAPFEIIEHKGRPYRVERYKEIYGHFTAGINRTSYYFHPDDLMRFFLDMGYSVTVMDDEEDKWGTNRYYRFFASR